MSNEWSYQVMGKEFGPVSFETLKARVRENKIGPDTLIQQGKGGWKSTDQVPGLIGPPPDKRVHFDDFEPDQVSELFVPPVTAKPSSAPAVSAAPSANRKPAPAMPAKRIVLPSEAPAQAGPLHGIATTFIILGHRQVAITH